MLRDVGEDPRIGNARREVGEVVELQIVPLGEVVVEPHDAGTERGVESRVAERGEHRRRVSARARLASVP